MSWLDISTYLALSHWGVVLILSGLFSGLILTLFLAVCDAEFDFKPKRLIPGAIFLWLLITVGFTACELMPTHQRMVKLKIAKIKNEAFNQANVDKGIETLERISKKLECKYLGCEKKSD